MFVIWKSVKSCTVKNCTQSTLKYAKQFIIKILLFCVVCDICQLLRIYDSFIINTFIPKCLIFCNNFFFLKVDPPMHKTI